MKAKKERFIPANSKEIKAGNFTIYTYENQNSQYLAVCYKGKSTKSYFHFRYMSAEAREKSIEEKVKYFKQEEQWAAEREAKAKQAAQEFRASLKVGTVLVYSWGYDQTNIDFFEVVGFKGKSTVVLRALQSESSPEDGFMTATKTAKKGCYSGEAFEKRLHPEYACVRMDFGAAKVWDGEPERYSWYA